MSDANYHQELYKLFDRVCLLLTNGHDGWRAEAYSRDDDAWTSEGASRSEALFELYNRLHRLADEVFWVYSAQAESAGRYATARDAYSWWFYGERPLVEYENTEEHAEYYRATAIEFQVEAAEVSLRERRMRGVE